MLVEEKEICQKRRQREKKGKRKRKWNYHFLVCSEATSGAKTNNGGFASGEVGLNSCWVEQFNKNKIKIK